MTRCVVFVGIGVLVCTVMVLAVLSSAARAEQAKGDITDKVNAIAASGRHQMDLPVALEEVVQPERPRSWFWDMINRVFGYYAYLVKILFWIALIAAAAFLLTPLGRAFLERLARQTGMSSEQSDELLDAGPTVEGLVISDDPVAQARALAKEGRAAEAIYVLLLAAVLLLQAQRAASRKETLTNRELLQRVGIGGGVRDAFGALVRAAELIRFGGRDPAMGEVERACEDYLVFRTGLIANG